MAKAKTTKSKSKPKAKTAKSKPKQKPKPKAKSAKTKAKPKAKAVAKASVAAKAKPAAKAKSAVKAKPAAVATPEIAATCDAIESYFTVLRERAVDGLSLYEQTLEPQSPASIAQLDAELAVTLPDDVKAFLRRGLRGASGSYDKDSAFAGVGFEWNGVDEIISHTKMLREIALDNDDEQSEIIRTGVALTSEEPELVLAADGCVHHWSFRNPKLEVAKSFRDFLAHWAASGCHSSHTFTELWPLVKDVAPLAIAPKQNLWLRAYKKQFPEHVAF